MGTENEYYIQRMEKAYDVDYAAVYEACKQAKDCFEGINRVLLRTGEACELGFGMNPNVTDLCGYTILDEKMCDTFHIAVGQIICSVVQTRLWSISISLAMAR